MNVKRFIHIMFVLSLILVTGFAATPASANTPTIIEGPYIWSGDIYTCDDFIIVGNTYGTQRNKLWFDENGNIEKGQNFLNVTETWSANGKTLEFAQHYPINGWIESYPNGYIVELGVVNYVIQGEGVVMNISGYYSYAFHFEAGEIIFDEWIKEVGHWEADWDAICEYFAP